MVRPWARFPACCCTPSAKCSVLSRLRSSDDALVTRMFYTVLCAVVRKIALQCPRGYHCRPCRLGCRLHLCCRHHHRCRFRRHQSWFHNWLNIDPHMNRTLPNTAPRRESFDLKSFDLASFIKRVFIRGISI